MSLRSFALAIALLLGATPSNAQDMGPFVRGRQFASMKQFDAAVVEWLLSKSSGKGEVALPTADSTSRSRDLRAATVTRGLAVSRLDAAD